MKRQSGITREYLYREGIRAPLTNRKAMWAAEAQWGSASHGWCREKYLMATDFHP